MTARAHGRGRAAFKYALLAVVCLGAAGFLVPKALAPKISHPWQIENAVPPGVTLIEPNGDGGNNTARVGDSDAALGDAYGRKLYTLDIDSAPGKSACLGACAQTWTPFAAPPDAKSSGAWSVVTRDDGNRQWAYHGKPLYLPTDDANSASEQKAEAHVALFKPADGMALPLGIGVQNVTEDGGYGLVDRQGMTLYAFDGDARDDKQACLGASCQNHWRPLLAPELTHGVGDFSLVARNDGRRQWAYKGEPLYTFDGDLVAGAAAGKAADKRWHVALLLDYFVPPNVRFATRYHGVTLTTDDGQTLYSRHPFVFQAGGFDIYKGLLQPYTKGKALGTKGCDEECLKTWHPFAAPADAVPSGFWEVAQRDDGTRQWMYKGYALYTYAGDVNPGDVNGNDIFDLIENDDGPYTVAIAGVGSNGGASALFWHIASP